MRLLQFKKKHPSEKDKPVDQFDKDHLDVLY